MTSRVNVHQELRECYCVCICCCAGQCGPQCPWCLRELHFCQCMYCPAEPCNPGCRHINCNSAEAGRTRQEMEQRFRELWQEGIAFERALTWMTEPTEPDRIYVLVDRQGNRRKVNSSELEKTGETP